MIYEFRTYDLKTRAVPEFEARAASKIKEGRQNYSQLFGFWYTEVGPLNSGSPCLGRTTIWEQRRKVRAEVAEKGIWPPDNAEFVRKMRSEIFPSCAVHEKPWGEPSWGQSMKCVSTLTLRRIYRR